MQPLRAAGLVFAFVAASCLADATAQTTAVVPPVCAELPGNAAIALPLRWSHGTMQVFIEPALLPANFVGQAITGLWLRRPTLPGDVAYPAITRTVTVRGGFLPFPAAQMVGSITQNRPATTTVLCGPVAVTTAAVPVPGAATTVGADLVHLVFTTPLVVAAGTLFLEFETSDAPLQISTEHWVDAVWFAGGADHGLVVAVGDGTCTTRPDPVQLRWVPAWGPLAGSTGTFELSGAPPTGGASAGFAMIWVGTDPQTRGPGAGYLGFGSSLGLVDPAMAACHQWAPLDVVWFGPTDGLGKFTSTLPIPAGAPIGLRLGVQGAWLDLSRAVLPLSLSNGLQVVVESAGVENRCNTIHFPAGSQVSPWPPFIGQMPVLRLEY
jgi:hypothetical protein